MSNTAECCPPQSASHPSKPNVPHPVSRPTGYEHKGRYAAIGNYDKVYVTGPEDADHALIVIYDIFGFWETTLRGSDLLASHLTLTSPTTIYMPDVFRGKPFPMDKDGDKDELAKFFAGTAKLSDRLPEVIEFANSLKHSKVSILGFCWGGKLVLQALANSKPFCCGAVVHPAMIAAEDGENLQVPLGFYPSMDEPKDVVEKISSAITKFKKSDYHLYDTVHHGWAAARADLSNPENLKQYEDVYQRVADYFTAVKC